VRIRGRARRRPGDYGTLPRAATSTRPHRWQAAAQAHRIDVPAQELAMPAVCDCFPELKSVTAAREARYRSDPGKPAPEGPQSSLEIKVTSIGNLNERVDTRNSGRHFIISEPKHVGGIADAPTPLA